MILAVMELVSSADKRQSLLEILRFVEKHVRIKSGCLARGVFEAASGKQEILYVERWRSAKEPHAHIRSGRYLRILNAMNLACETPKDRISRSVKNTTYKAD